MKRARFSGERDFDFELEAEGFTDAVDIRLPAFLERRAMNLPPFPAAFFEQRFLDTLLKSRLSLLCH